MSYKGLPAQLKAALAARDQYRCRWCGATNRGTDAHHIEYRRGYAYDVLENLVSLCRLHHDFVHGAPLGNGDRIVKAVAQAVLLHLVDHPGVTGASYWRRLKRQWVLEGKCERHGVKADECQDCRWQAVAACVECGNDDPAEGYDLCTDCLEATEGASTPSRVAKVGPCGSPA